MMNDIDKLSELLSSWGVEYSYTAHVGTQNISVESETHFCDNNSKRVGCTGFYTNFEFDYDGKFICMGAWE